MTPSPPKRRLHSRLLLHFVWFFWFTTTSRYALAEVNAAEAAAVASESTATDAEAPDPTSLQLQAGTTPLRLDDTTLAGVQASHAKLLEHFLGTTSKSIRFDWRNSPLQLGFYVGDLVERNNYASQRVGILARKNFSDTLLEINLSGVLTQPTLSSELLALTPYQQSGRPSRFELEINAGLPLAEGVVTPQWSWLPPAQMVWVAYTGLRYALYPSLLENHWQNLWRPDITDAERAELAPLTLGGMHVDGARFQVMLGTSLDVYLVPGIVLTPRVMMAVPIGFDLLTGSDLGFWWEGGIAIGYVF